MSFIPSIVQTQQQSSSLVKAKATSIPQHELLQLNKSHLNSTFIKEVKKYYISETIKLSVATGPLYAIAGQMQYLSKNITLQTFKFTSHEKYFSLARHMFKQGFLGMYKGNFIRLSFFISSVSLKQVIENNYDSYLRSKVFIPKILREMLFFTLADMLLNPLLFIETRFMLQNKHGNFRHYKNIFNLLSVSYSELYKGSILSIYRNFFFVLGVNLYFILPSFASNVFSIVLSHSLSYPFLTIQRNIMARSSFLLYYENDLLVKEQRGILRINEIREYIRIYGFTKLYKGFPVYLSAVCLWHYYVPLAAKYKYYQNLL